MMKINNTFIFKPIIKIFRNHKKYFLLLSPCRQNWNQNWKNWKFWTIYELKWLLKFIYEKWSLIVIGNNWTSNFILPPSNVIFKLIAPFLNFINRPSSTCERQFLCRWVVMGEPVVLISQSPSFLKTLIASNFREILRPLSDSTPSSSKPSFNLRRDCPL